VTDWDLLLTNWERDGISPGQESEVERLRRNERSIVVDPIILGEVRFGILLLPPLPSPAIWRSPS